MAANTLKSIGKFSVDAIHSLIRKRPLSKETLKELQDLENDLIKPEKIAKHARGEKLSDQEIFTLRIEPVIRQTVTEFNTKGKSCF